MTEKMRYSDEELQEFKELIQAKLEKANLEYERLRSSLSNLDGNDVADTSPTFKVLEEGATTLNKEEASRLSRVRGGCRLQGLPCQAADAPVRESR